MTFDYPWLLILIPLLIAALWWWQRRTVHPMGPARKHALLTVRSVVVALAVIALAGPSTFRDASSRAVIVVMDQSLSLGPGGQLRASEAINAIADQLPGDVSIGVVGAGDHPSLLRLPGTEWSPLAAAAPDADGADANNQGAPQSDLAAGVRLAAGLFPAGATRQILLVSDGLETHGDLYAAARELALSGIALDALPVAGDAQADARVLGLDTSRSRSHEGATIELSARVQSSVDDAGTVKLYENGIQVASFDVEVAAGDVVTVPFVRTPEVRNLYRYRVRLEGFSHNAIVANDEAMAVVDVRGRPMLLYVEGEADQSGYLVDAMDAEGIRLVTRPPQGIPTNLQELSAFDGVVISDVPATDLSYDQMNSLRNYVELLGGGLTMIGGERSFGVGGYYRTPIEEILPIRMQAPDHEERMSVGVVLVIDRSGSMDGQKIELVKSAALATAELLQSKDQIGVVAFDSSASWVVPLGSAANPSIQAQIAMINSGGGTNIYPGMTAAFQALQRARVRVKHMIVLTDGQTNGSGYQQLATQINSSGITISTVGVGQGADTSLLQSIASAGGGSYYFTADPSTIPQIFTQDTMQHVGRLIREANFVPRQVESHPMLKGWDGAGARPLLGYVRTDRRSLSQVPLVTDTDDPLLAHWRYGTGKVTAFTSDCKSRWSALWIAGWPGYGQFWAQVLRETARPPQGRNMDIRIEEDGERMRVVVELQQDAASFANAARVEADIFHVAAGSLGSGMEETSSLVLNQAAPGRYEADFLPDEAGLYVARARHGADLVSAGHVHDVSTEAATGSIDEVLLERATAAAGGQVITDADAFGLNDPEQNPQRIDLIPWFLRLLLLVALADLVIRRWENIVGIWEVVTPKRT